MEVVAAASESLAMLVPRLLTIDSLAPRCILLNSPTRLQNRSFLTANSWGVSIPVRDRPRGLSSANVAQLHRALPSTHAHPSMPIGAFSAAHAAHAIASTRSSCRPSRHVPNVSFAASVDCHVRRAAADTLVALVIATSFETGLPQSNAANSDSASPRQPWPGPNRSPFHEQPVAAQ
jgi:hypothetical protein